MSDLIRALTGDRERPELTFVRRYRTTVADLLEACTTPERLARWFGTVEGAPGAVGDTFAVQLGAEDDRAVGEVVGCDERGFQVSWSWQGEAVSRVEVRVADVGAGQSELTVRHRLAEPGHAVGYGGGWEQSLQALARAVGDPDPGALPDAEAEALGVETWRAMTSRRLEVEQLIAAPVEAVWQALTSADGLKSWWWRHWPDTTIETDPRVGGAYRIETAAYGITLTGTYLVVDEPTRLAYTWVWSDADGVSRDEAVDIRLAPADGGTHVSVRHTGPWTDDEPVTAYEQGWRFTLGQLADQVETG